LHERTLDPSRYPSQVLCLSEQIRFCSDVEKCLSNVGGNPKEHLIGYKRQLIKQLEHLSSSTSDEPLGQLKLKSLVLDLIHHISILDQLIIAENNQSIICWTWRRQLRFYLV
jgi:dynein heavy chain 2, cytosolic